MSSPYEDRFLGMSRRYWVVAGILSVVLPFAISLATAETEPLLIIQASNRGWGPSLYQRHRFWSPSRWKIENKKATILTEDGRTVYISSDQYLSWSIGPKRRWK